MNECDALLTGGAFYGNLENDMGFHGGMANCSSPDARPVPAVNAHATAPSPKDQVRIRILAMAEERFMNHGFSRITMDDLAAELGMSKKTLYAHFASKTEVLEAMLQRRFDDIQQGMLRISNDPTLDFQTKSIALVDFISKRVSDVKPVFMYDLQRHAPEAFKMIHNFRANMIPEVFGRLFEEGRRAGMVRKDMDARVVIEVLLNSIQYIVTPEALTRLGLTVQQAFDTIHGVMFNGIMTPKWKRMYEATRGK